MKKLDKGTTKKLLKAPRPTEAKDSCHAIS